MNNPAETKSISVGDLLQKLSRSTSQQLNILLNALPNQSPELRTEKLRAFLKLAKKRFAQVYAICTWLNEDHVRLYLQSISAMQEEISHRENKLNQIQDSLFFVHAGLYGQRVRPLEIALSIDVLATGTYNYLPVSVFRCGQPIEPCIIAEDQLKKELNLNIKCKLLLSDMLASNSYDSLRIEQGYVTLRKNSLYLLKLSLFILHEDSPWRVLDFEILVQNHATELIADDNRFELETKKRKCLASCRNILPENEVDSADSVGQRSACIDQLTTISRICERVAYGCVLKALYTQALEASRTTWQDRIDVKLVEDTSGADDWVAGGTSAIGSFLSVRFWNEPLGEMR